MKMTLNLTRKTILGLLAIALVGTAAAAITIFTHTFPAVPTAAAALITNCSTLTASPAGVVIGFTGYIRFSCGVDPAITTVATPPPVTPLFTLPSTYAKLFIMSHLDSSCGTSSTLILMLNGTAISSLGSTTPLDYCAFVASPAPSGNLATFTVTWTQ